MSNLHQSGRLEPRLAQMLNRGSIPPIATSRWLPRRKAQVVDAVTAGLMSIDEACDLYGLTLEELIGWQRSLKQFGMDGLRVSRTRSQVIEEARPFRPRTVFSMSYRAQGHA